MAHFHFLFERRLCEAATERGVEEQRIISEAIAAGRCFEQDTFHLSTKGAHQAALFSQRNNAHESRRAMGNAAHSIQKQLIVCCVGCTGTGESRRIDARGAT